jgi:hypothetical protein
MEQQETTSKVGKYDVGSWWEMEASRSTFSLKTLVVRNQQENGYLALEASALH